MFQPGVYQIGAFQAPFAPAATTTSLTGRKRREERKEPSYRPRGRSLDRPSVDEAYEQALRQAQAEPMVVRGPNAIDQIVPHMEAERIARIEALKAEKARLRAERIAREAEDEEAAVAAALILLLS